MLPKFSVAVLPECSVAVHINVLLPHAALFGQVLCKLGKSYTRAIPTLKAATKKVSWQAAALSVEMAWVFVMIISAFSRWMLFML